MKYDYLLHRNYEARLKKEQDLRKAESIISENITDEEKAFKLCRLYKSSEIFRSQYFYLANEKGSYYEEKSNIIQTIYMYICKCEMSGLYAKVLDDSKYRLISNRNIDSRVIIKDYIEDFDSYKLDEFLEKHSITKNNLKSCETCIERLNPELYEEYLKIKNINENKKIIMPIYYLSEIKIAIETGTTSTGESFDIYEFWRLFPFKVDNIDREFQKFYKLHPGFQEIRFLNAKTNREKGKIKYLDFINNFIEVLGFDKEHTIINYMKENNIKTCNLLNRNRILNNLPLYNYFNLTKEDIINILDFMELNNIPLVEDCFLKASKDYSIQLRETKQIRKLLKYNMIDKEE